MDLEESELKGFLQHLPSLDMDKVRSPKIYRHKIGQFTWDNFRSQSLLTILKGKFKFEE